MRYVCLIYDNEKLLADFTTAETESFMNEYFAFTNSIREGGSHVAGEALHPVSTATTLRVRDGKLLTMDGPFAETKEQLGGFYLIDAQNLDEALQIAARIPSVRTGTVEVRECVDFTLEHADIANGSEAASLED